MKHEIHAQVCLDMFIFFNRKQVCLRTFGGHYGLNGSFKATSEYINSSGINYFVMLAKCVGDRIFLYRSIIVLNLKLFILNCFKTSQL